MVTILSFLVWLGGLAVSYWYIWPIALVAFGIADFVTGKVSDPTKTPTGALKWAERIFMGGLILSAVLTVSVALAAFFGAGSSVATTGSILDYWYVPMGALLPSSALFGLGLLGFKLLQKRAPGVSKVSYYIMAFAAVVCGLSAVTAFLAAGATLAAKFGFLAL